MREDKGNEMNRNWIPIAFVLFLGIAAVLAISYNQNHPDLHVDKDQVFFMGPRNIHESGPNGASIEIVEVKNPDGVGVGQGKFAFGARCAMAWGAESKVFIEMDPNTVLLEKTKESADYPYTPASVWMESSPSPCLVGTLYQLPKEFVVSLDKNFRQLTKQNRDEREHYQAETRRKAEQSTQERERIRKLINSK